MLLRIFLKAIEKHRFTFLSMPGVVLVGLGLKMTGNTCTGLPSLILGVKKKMPVRSIPSDQIIPRHIDRLPTDVVEVGRIRLLGYALPEFPGPSGDLADQRAQRVRPAQPGVSIAHYRVSAGTLGALVKGDFPGGAAILSNNHILANGTDGRDGLSRIGDPILQPGPYDNGGPRDIIARLHSFSPMITEAKGGRGRINTIDAALAVPIKPDLVKGAVLGLGPVRGTAQAYPGMTVLKSGRSSGVTTGQVFSLENTIRVENEDRTYLFENQIGTTMASEGGDSGSLLMDRSGRAVGLLFAGSENQTFFNPIGPIFEYFNVSLAE